MQGFYRQEIKQGLSGLPSHSKLSRSPRANSAVAPLHEVLLIGVATNLGHNLDHSAVKWANRVRYEVEMIFRHHQVRHPF